MAGLCDLNKQLAKIHPTDPGPFVAAENVSRSTVHRHRKAHKERANVWAEIKSNGRRFGDLHRQLTGTEDEYEDLRDNAGEFRAKVGQIVDQGAEGLLYKTDTAMVEYAISRPTPSARRKEPSAAA